MLKITEITNDIVAKRFKHCFKLYVGPKMTFSIEEFCRVSEIDRRVIDSWRGNSQESFPSGENLLKCIAVLGNDFANDIFSLIGLTVYAPEEEEEDQKVTPLDLVSEATDYAHISVEAFKDHRKKEAMHYQGNRLISKIVRFNQSSLRTA
jgi:hypothetical protein